MHIHANVDLCPWHFLVGVENVISRLNFHHQQASNYKRSAWTNTWQRKGNYTHTHLRAYLITRESKQYLFASVFRKVKSPCYLIWIQVFEMPGPSLTFDHFAHTHTHTHTSSAERCVLAISNTQRGGASITSDLLYSRSISSSWAERLHETLPE